MIHPQPQQTDQPLRTNAGGNGRETIMGVNHLDDRHRTEQEERDARRRCDGLVELISKPGVITN